jgi:hypothetical protein
MEKEKKGGAGLGKIRDSSNKPKKQRKKGGAMSTLDNVFGRVQSILLEHLEAEREGIEATMRENDGQVTLTHSVKLARENPNDQKLKLSTSLTYTLGRRRKQEEIEVIEDFALFDEGPNGLEAK